MPRYPIDIPSSLSTDRAVKNLMTQWRNYLLRHRVCRRRVNWKNATAATIETRKDVI